MYDLQKVVKQIILNLINPKISHSQFEIIKLLLNKRVNHTVEKLYHLHCYQKQMPINPNWRKPCKSGDTKDVYTNKPPIRLRLCLNLDQFQGWIEHPEMNLMT